MRVRLGSALAFACAMLCGGCGERFHEIVPECVKDGELVVELIGSTTGSTDDPEPGHMVMAPGTNNDFLHASLDKLEPQPDGRFAFEIRRTGKIRTGEVQKGKVSACTY